MDIAMHVRSVRWKGYRGFDKPFTRGNNTQILRQGDVLITLLHIGCDISRRTVVFGILRNPSQRLRRVLREAHRPDDSRKGGSSQRTAIDLTQLGVQGIPSVQFERIPISGLRVAQEPRYEHGGGTAAC